MRRAGLKTLAALVLLALCCLPCLVQAEEQASGPSINNTPAPSAAPSNGQRVEFEYEVEAYYTSVGAYISLTERPIEDVSDKREYEIYSDMFLESYIPRFMVLEASINPMPLLGLAVRDRMPAFYDSAEVTKETNLIKAITAGFEEPYALSVFLGNVVKFNRQGEAKTSKIGNKGYMGYLFSYGDYHIKDNKLVQDAWKEVEWKIKGDRKYKDEEHSWSFRIGCKAHSNPDITDVLYVSARRSRLDYNAPVSSIIHNSAIEYTYDMSLRGLSAVQHHFFIEKKFPDKEHKLAFTLALGFIYDTGRKYKGALADNDKEDFQIILRPNIEF